MRLRIHHFGIVVRDLHDHLTRRMGSWLAGVTVPAPIEDPLQQVRLVLIDLPGGTLELIEPIGPSSPIAGVLSHAAATHHHVCFEVADLAAELAACRGQRMAIVSPPKPAVAFAGRPVAFVMGKDGLLWELLQAAG